LTHLTAPVKHLLFNAVKKLDLNLADKTVLTEAASGHFAYTPLIACLAGARKVIAFGKDTRYGSFNSVCGRLRDLSKALGCSDRLMVTDTLPDAIMGSADIITNSGMLRPIDRRFISCLSSKAVISLMYEPWELRHSDIDISAAKAMNIPVIGVNEEDDRIRILDYLPLLAQQQLTSSGASARGERIAVIGNDLFAEKIYHGLSSHHHVTLFSLTQAEDLLDAAVDINIIVLAQHHEKNRHFLNTDLLNRLAPHSGRLKVLQIAGGLIDVEHAGHMGFSVFPQRQVAPGVMGWTLAELGPQPVIDLNAAGIKAGAVVHDVFAGLSDADQAVREALVSDPLLKWL